MVSGDIAAVWTSPDGVWRVEVHSGEGWLDSRGRPERPYYRVLAHGRLVAEPRTFGQLAALPVPLYQLVEVAAG